MFEYVPSSSVTVNKYSNRRVGSYPRTVDEGLDLVCPKVRKGGKSCWSDVLEEAGIWCTSRAPGLRQGHRGGSSVALERRQGLGAKMQEYVEVAVGAGGNSLLLASVLSVK